MRVQLGWKTLRLGLFVVGGAVAVWSEAERVGIGAGRAGALAAIPSEASTAASSGPDLVPTIIDPPAEPGSTSPTIAAEIPMTQVDRYDILMTWLAPGAKGGRLMFSRYSGESWSPPVTVAEPVSLLTRNDPPSLTVIDTQGVRRTLIARTGDTVARSPDAGRTWTRLPSSALPFASFAGGDEGGYAFWLGANADGTSRLLGARILAGETVLDPVAESGMSTAAAMTWDSPVVVYRDRTSNGGQAISCIRRQNARWLEPRIVHVESSPKDAVGGLEAAALRRDVAVAWYSEAGGQPHLSVAFSADAGGTFGPPVEADAPEGTRSPRSPVAVELDDQGGALLLWLASNGPGETTLNLARVTRDGKRGAELTLARGPSAWRWGVPKIVRAGEGVAVAWTEGVLARPRAALVPLAAIPPALVVRPRSAAGRSGAEAPRSGHGRVGELVPEIELVSLQGEPVSMSALRGQAVLLNLWATWCAPCVAEMPELKALHERWAAEGLKIVGVSADNATARDRVQRFVTERSLPFAIWLDPDMRLARALRSQTLPATFVLDREGKILLRLDRPISAREPALDAALSRALE